MVNWISITLPKIKYYINILKNIDMNENREYYNKIFYIINIL